MVAQFHESTATVHQKKMSLKLSSNELPLFFKNTRIPYTWRATMKKSVNASFKVLLIIPDTYSMVVKMKLKKMLANVCLEVLTHSESI